MPGPHLVFGELVERVQVDVGKELRGQIADRQAEVRRLVGQALVHRHAIKKLRGAAQLEILTRIVKQDQVTQPEPPGITNLGCELGAQDSLVDADKEVGQIQLQVKR